MDVWARGCVDVGMCGARCPPPVPLQSNPVNACRPVQVSNNDITRVRAEVESLMLQSTMSPKVTVKVRVDWRRRGSAAVCVANTHQQPGRRK
eukprot:44671-Chlamydomonas_euryale.AAC.1